MTDNAISQRIILLMMVHLMEVVLVIDDLVIKNFERLTDTDKHIWQVIKSSKKSVLSLNLTQLASKCNVSPSAIVRFSKRISLQGFSEMRYLLKQENIVPRIDEDIFHQYQVQINEFVEQIINKDFTDICRALLKSKKVFVYGTGTLQRNIAQEIRRLFLTINITIFFIEGVDELSSLPKSLTKDDIVILITLKGTSDNARLFARQLRTSGVPFISVVERVDNEISRLSNYNIFVDPVELKVTDGQYLSVKDPYFIFASVLYLKMYLYTFREK
ncbi:MurR/RpiR family transcriptional regulator [Lactobacillus sp. ESL0731]|uniref:MurR/RpiR family transcriptional regulator n=1 Tax=unclassified Lactobacillus TaxID=2620435 RepID=UPI0023F69273|nr:MULTISPECIES: MurR/RpiR family transcriptional regulator [unclassified Lactobacillus]WEV51098.1 MurR/RpiR family transcriptional regulator [Lactobacillus sp. ESL0700]WEV62227.1 MurR/RpiR family transcriptional regulator [Lactobacillus sp. ESL0731]